MVTAAREGASSPPTTLYFHQHTDSKKGGRAEPKPPQYDCFSQGQTWQFQGIAYSNNVDITNTVGPMTWSYSNTGVLTTNTTLQTLLPNQVQTTAKSPGITNLFASVSETTSSPFPYTTCLVQYLRLQIGGQSQAGNSVTINNAGSVALTATLVDTLGATVASPPLPLGTTNPQLS